MFRSGGITTIQNPCQKAGRQSGCPDAGRTRPAFGEPMLDDVVLAGPAKDVSDPALRDAPTAIDELHALVGQDAMDFIGHPKSNDHALLHRRQHRAPPFYEHHRKSVDREELRPGRGSTGGDDNPTPS